MFSIGYCLLTLLKRREEILTNYKQAIEPKYRSAQDKVTLFDGVNKLF